MQPGGRQCACAALAQRRSPAHPKGLAAWAPRRLSLEGCRHGHGLCVTTRFIFLTTCGKRSTGALGVVPGESMCPLSFCVGLPTRLGLERTHLDYHFDCATIRARQIRECHSTTPCASGPSPASPTPLQRPSWPAVVRWPVLVQKYLPFQSFLEARRVFASYSVRSAACQVSFPSSAHLHQTLASASTEVSSAFPKCSAPASGCPLPPDWAAQACGRPSQEFLCLPVGSARGVRPSQRPQATLAQAGAVM